MSKIKQMFVVTIEIDTEKAKPFPEGFKNPASNCDDNGMNWNTYPNWELNYQGRETDFIDSIWADFRNSFKYDGLKCQIFGVNPMQVPRSRMGVHFENLTDKQEIELLAILSENIDERYNNVEYWDEEIIKSFHNRVGARSDDSDDELDESQKD
jgi:hypothetical protein